MSTWLWVLVIYFIIDLIAVSILWAAKSEIRFTGTYFVIMLFTHIPAMVILIKAASLLS
jgi:hypothetical protein